MINVIVHYQEINEKIDKLLAKLPTAVIKQAMFLALQAVGFRAVSEYMIQGSIVEAIEAPVDPNLLTIRTGRLAGSIVAAPRFSHSELPTDIETAIGGMRGKTLIKTSGEQEAINEVVILGDEIHGYKGSKVPYAAKHELGQGIRPRPFLLPAVKDSGSIIEEIIEKTIDYQMKKSGF